MSKKHIDPWVRTFTVSDPVRHKKGYTLYKVTSRVFPRNSIQAVTQVTVWKRYNDFKKLHKALSTLHQGLYLKGTFPAFAKARFFGRFDDGVIEERRRCALELLEFVAQHPPLFTSQVFVKFFEGGQVLDPPAEPDEIICKDNILQPTPSFSRNNSHESASSVQCDNEETDNSLGGIWKHRQAADEISIGSNAAEGEDEDDDRTTFTDDDPSKSTISDLSEFDPLLDINSSRTPSCTVKPEDLCHDWLLSAFQSFGSCDKNDGENLLTFPKPFDGLEDLETPPEVNASNDETDVVQTKNDAALDIQEFDPIYQTVTDSLTPQVTNSDFPESFKEHCSSAETPSDFTYILTAAKSVTTAQEAELSQRYFEAFTFYKAAIDTLLLGVKSEKSVEQCEAIQKKILQYLKRAEEIYETHLVESKKQQKPVIDHVSKDVTISEDTYLGIRRSVKDLAKYRVIGILSKVLLVLDVVTNITCVVKVLRKSPEPLQPDAPNIAPRNIDFIVQLYEMYETPDTIFLILEYASGGRLWDYISSYLQRSPLTPPNHDISVKREIKATLDNVYSGKKLQADKTVQKTDQILIPNDSLHSAINEPAAAEIYPSSYAALFRNYAANAPANNVPLAKCHTKSSVPFDLEDDSFLTNTLCNESRGSSEHPVAKELQNCQELDGSLRELDKGHIFKKNGFLNELSSCSLSLDNQNVNNNIVHSSNTELKDVSSTSCNILKDRVEPKLHLDFDTVTSPNANFVGELHGADLPTFLSGDIGKTFMSQTHQETLRNSVYSEEESSTLHVSANDLVDYSSRKLHFTEVFHKMDVEVSLANSKPTHLPESCIVIWVAEIVKALESLHKLGIIWKDLRPENILLGTEGHVLLSYQSQWNSVDQTVSEKAIQNFYAAPEVGNVFPVTSACDWWSLGAILFELLTGRKLVSCYPSGITSHTNIVVPDGISVAAKDLLCKLLRYNPSERLGGGLQGVEDVKYHPFFRSVDWTSLRSS